MTLQISLSMLTDWNAIYSISKIAAAKIIEITIS